MLPQAMAGTPAPFSRWAVSAVVVVLPLLPVMAMIFEPGACLRTPAAKNSISDTTGTSTAAGGGVAYRHSRRQCHQIDAGEGGGGKRPGDHFNRRCNAGQRFAVGRVVARIGNADDGALTMQPLGHRQSGLAEPDHQNAFALEFHQRSFKVDSPISTSMMVMIQKRTTTCVSFQPVCSKW
jgi:hypothetical protein